MSSYLSYLMGAENIQDAELEDLGVKIKDRTSDGDRMLVIPDDKLSRYVEFIKVKLANGFWNEVIFNKDNYKIKENFNEKYKNFTFNFSFSFY